MNEDEGGRKGRGFAAGCVEGLYKRVQRVKSVQRVVVAAYAAIKKRGFAAEHYGTDFSPDDIILNEAKNLITFRK